MPRLGLGIHEFGAAGKKLVDPKAKPWDDERDGGASVASKLHLQLLQLLRLGQELFFTRSGPIDIDRGEHALFH